MNVLLVVTEDAGVSARARVALRLAAALSRLEETRLSVFLVSDGVACGLAGGVGTPEAPVVDAPRWVAGLISVGVEVRASAECLAERAIGQADLLIGVEPGGLAALATRIAGADRVLVF